MFYQANKNTLQVTLKGPATYDDLDETWDDVSIYLISKYLNNIHCQHLYSRKCNKQCIRIVCRNSY